MSKIIFALSMILPLQSVFSQITFNQTVGGTARDQAISAQTTSDGGYIVVGWTLSYGAGNWDIYLVKISATGSLQWTKTYGGPGHEVDCYVRQTFDGGFIISARTTSFGVASADVYLIKTDGNGDLEWTNTIGGSDWEEGHSIIQIADSSFAHVGYTMSFGAGDHDYYLIKSDKNGGTQWTKTFGGTGVDNGHIIMEALNGGYIILGETTSFGAGGTDFYVVKTDDSGNHEWSKTYGGNGDDHGWDITATNDSCYVLAGYTESFGAGDNDMYLIKITKNGDLIWSRTYGTAGDEEGLALKQTNDGGFIIAGETVPPGPDSADVYIVKTDALGIPQWSRSFGGVGDEGSQSILQTADRGYFISGYANSLGEGDWDFYMIKTDSSGKTATCYTDGPVALMSNTTASTLISNAATLTSTGGITANQSSIQNNGGVLNSCTFVTAVEEGSVNENDFVLYPNPATDGIEITNPNGILAIEIYNQSGQLILSKNKLRTTKETLDISQFNNGIYHARCISINSTVVKKLIKM